MHRAILFCRLLAGDKIDPADLLGSFNLDNDLLEREKNRTYSKADDALDDLAEFVD